jgi:hypothetical protein
MIRRIRQAGSNAKHATADVKRWILKAKSCAPNRMIRRICQISHIDHWQAPQA